jgi:hypothetical protein
MVRRVLAVLAAALLVGTVALATLESPDMPLGQLLLAIDRQSLTNLQSVLEQFFTHWMWTEIVLPVLARPAWLIPAALGLICVGLSLTLPNGRRAERPRQRRF